MKFLRPTHLCERNLPVIYEFIKNYHEEFGLRWLFRKFEVYPNGYYNYLKNRKKSYLEEKAKTQRKIVEIYHERNGVPGYRMTQKLLVAKGHV